MTRKSAIPRESLVILAEKLADLRERALTEDENTLLTLKMEGKTDKQVAAVFRLSVPVTNQKKHKLYALINGLAWWADNRGLILAYLNKAAKDRKCPAETAAIFELVATRLTKNEVAREVKVSAWKVTRAIDFALAEFRFTLEFIEFFESLRLGYKLPWKGVNMIEENVENTAGTEEGAADETTNVSEEETTETTETTETEIVPDAPVETELNTPVENTETAVGGIEEAPVGTTVEETEGETKVGE